MSNKPTHNLLYYGDFFRFLAELLPPVNSKRARALLEFDERTVHTTTEILTAHCAIGSFANMLVLSYQEYCRSCHNVKETK